MTPQNETPDETNETPPPTSRHEFPVSDETIERVLSPEDTLVRKPTTFELEAPPNVKRETRYGEALLGNTVKLIFAIRGNTAKTVTVEITDRLVVGRRASAAQTRPDLDLNRYGGYINGVSRKHIQIIKDADILTVTDLGSKNGTYLNGAKLIPNQSRILRDGDELCLGTLFLRVYFRPAALDTQANDTAP